MKKHLYIYGLTILLSTMATSCKKDFLNIVPLGKQVAVTTTDYDLLMNQSDLYISSTTGRWMGVGLMGDDIAAENTFYKSAKLRSQQAFTWADDIYQATDIPFELRDWISNLYTVNKVINEIMASTGGTEQQKKAIQAEAYATRAYIYFQFVNFYGKPYQTATAGTDPAFPIITEADVNATNFTRSSVQQVYDFIITDLTTSIANLPLTNSKGVSRFTKAGAEALLGKVYVFSGKNSEALAVINAAFSDNATLTSPARLYDYNKEFALGGKFLPIGPYGPANSPEVNFNDVTESLLAYSSYNGLYNGNGYGTDFVVLSPEARALFSSSDLRLKFYTPNLQSTVVNPSGRLSKYADYSSPLVKTGLQISELYLLSAECKARLNDLSGAKSDVEILRKSRMPIADATIPGTVSSSQKNLLQYIFDERVREFATQGYRWFDMRRLSVDPILTAPTFKHVLYNDATFTNTTVFTLNPVRLTQKLPPYIMNANPQLTNNP
ncbi:MAG: RagB/SusD family nutrient uptake outer membrane protein [Bacteroidota bacterium]